MPIDLKAIKSGDFNQIKGSLVKLAPVVLVFTHDHFTLRGALAKRGSGEVLAEASSVNLDLDAALEEILQDLRGAGHRLPKRAVMGVTYAVSGLFELPVDPKKPRPDKQMQELVRFELEAQLGEFNDLWSVPAVMQGRGYINQDQRRIALEMLKERRSSGDAGLVRFGDIAVEQGFLSTAQRDEVMDLQGDIATLDEMLECGWQAQVLEREDQEPLKIWYGAGLDRIQRNTWARCFRHEGIKLTNFYPIEGLGLISAVERIEEGQAALVFSIGVEQAHCYRIEKDAWNRPQITAMTSDHLDGRTNLDALSEIGLSMLQPSVVKICVQLDPTFQMEGEQTSSVKPVEALLEQFSAKLDCPVEILSDSGGATLTPLMMLAGLAGHQSKEHFFVAIAAQDPGPPLWKDINFLRYAVPAAIVLGMLANEIYTRVNTWSLDRQLVTLKKDTSQQSLINKEMSAVLGEMKQTEAEVVGLEAELAELQQTIDAGMLFANRATLAHDLLAVLEQTVNSEVMLESFSEPPRSKNPGFHLKAWAISETAAVRFVSKLKRNMRDVAYAVVSEQNQSDKNRYGMLGHSIDLWLVPEAVKNSSEALSGVL